MTTALPRARRVSSRSAVLPSHGRSHNLSLVLQVLYSVGAMSRADLARTEVRDEDAARLSPFVRHHVNMLGRCSFHLPEPPGGLRPPRGPDAADKECPSVRGRQPAGR